MSIGRNRTGSKHGSSLPGTSRSTKRPEGPFPSREVRLSQHASERRSRHLCLREGHACYRGRAPFNVLVLGSRNTIHAMPNRRQHSAACNSGASDSARGAHHERPGHQSGFMDAECWSVVGSHGLLPGAAPKGAVPMEVMAWPHDVSGRDYADLDFVRL